MQDRPNDERDWHTAPPGPHGERGPDEWRRGYGNYGVTGRGPSAEHGWGPGPWPRQREAESWPEADYGMRGQYRGTPAVQSWTAPGPYTGRGPQGYERSEAAILEDVCERLTWHGQVDASSITVRVEQGEVVLEGEVDSRAAKRMAEDAADSVAGVHDVHNRLRVRRH
jgi:hypothetical protein